jgi:hypothetical protein
MKVFVACLAISSALTFSACAVSLPWQAPAVTTRPQIVHFVATPSKIENGQSVLLTWEVEDAEKVSIDHGIGEVPLTGSKEVKPDALIAYNLTATNAGGVAGSAVIVNVVHVTHTGSPASPPEIVPDITPTSTAPATPYVILNGAILVGADGHYVALRNNPAARNPTWAQLKAFLQQDDTDKKIYDSKSFTCGDFAETLHNNAEAAGIRAALVGLLLKPASLQGEGVKHSLNCFETTDSGTVYIDATSSSQGIYADKIVDVTIGKDYIPVAIFPQAGYSQTWSNMGKIEAIEIIKW